MAHGWTLWEFEQPSGRRPFSEWLAGIPEAAQAFVLNRLLKMEGVTRWPEKWASDYKGYDGIVELRVTFNKVQYRPLGMYGKHERRSFVLLAGAIEKNRKLPKSALKAAADRRDQLLEEPDRAKRYEF